jgi:serine/threonine protein kinase
MLESGQTLAARYRLLRKLGAGQAIQVWLARDAQTGSDRVLKVLESAVSSDRALPCRRGGNRSSTATCNPRPSTMAIRIHRVRSLRRVTWRGCAVGLARWLPALAGVRRRGGATRAASCIAT